jgi:branched-chain amino acid transport system substrate-binding protein
VRKILLGALATATVLTPLAVAVSPGAASAKSGPIKLGALYTLSGPTAAFGEFNLHTEQALITYLNAHGGIDHRNVKLVYYNTGGTPSTAVSDAEKLIADGVTGIVYAGTSVTAAQAAVVFDKAKIPSVDFNPTDTWATGNKWTYSFTDYNIVRPQGVAIDAYARHLGIRKLGILTDPTPLGKQLASDTKAAAHKEGVTIVGTQSYAFTASTMTTQLKTLKAAGAQGVVLPGETGLGQVYTSLRGMGWSPYVFTEYAGYFVGYTSQGSLAPRIFSACQTNIPEGKTLPKGLDNITKFVVKKTGIKAVGLVSALLNENDSLLIFKWAIEHAKSTTGTKIRNEVQKIRHVGFTVRDWTYTFTKKNHDGWPDSHSYMCVMKPLGPFTVPYTAPGATGT